jgi:hypothetical protein
MYSLYEDQGYAENGLIPTNDNLVNYFKTYDDITPGEAENASLLPVPPGKESEPLSENKQTGSIDKLFDGVNN